MFNNIKNPPQVYSWQTFILLSFISIAFAGLSFLINFLNGITEINFVQNLIANFGFIFLIIAISWISVEQNWLIRPWLIGGLICLFIYGNFSNIPLYILLIIFPLIASIIAVFPYFINRRLDFHWVNEYYRLKVILILGIHLMFSCWIQIYFLLNNWIDQYPTLLSDDLSKSSFVININPSSYPRGIYLLDQIKSIFNTQLNNKQWLIAQKWLQKNAMNSNDIMKLKQKIIEKDTPLLEDTLWNLEFQTKQIPSGYSIKIKAIWKGPKVSENEYFCQTICVLQPLFFAADEPDITTSQLQCEKTTIQGWKN